MTAIISAKNEFLYIGLLHFLAIFCPLLIDQNWAETSCKKRRFFVYRFYGQKCGFLPGFKNKSGQKSDIQKFKKVVKNVEKVPFLAYFWPFLGKNDPFYFLYIGFCPLAHFFSIIKLKN